MSPRFIGVALLMGSAALNAQISQLATSGDGGTLLFRSTFRLTSEPTLGPQGKIYRWQNGVWTNLATAGDPGANAVPPNVFNPFISQDAGIFGWQVDFGCLRCTFRIGPYYSSEVRGITLPPEFPRGTLKISPNGRYLTADSLPVSGAKYLDTQTGSLSDLPISLNLPAIREIANDGTVLLFDRPDSTSLTGTLSIWNPRTGQQPLNSSAAVTSVFSATGTRIATEENETPSAQAGVRTVKVLDTSDPTGGATLALYPSDVYDPHAPSLAQPAWDAAGSQLIYRNYSYLTSNYELQRWGPGDGNNSRTILNHPEGIANFALSGDGNIIWAVTGSNRLLRLTQSTGQIDEILPPLPATGTVFPYAVPGSAYFIAGKGFSGNASVTDNSASLPVIAVQPEGLYVQIPWDAAPGTHQFATRSGADDAFEAVAKVQLSDIPVPNLVTNTPDKTGLGYVKAAHQDFSSLISPESPAKAGETIHVYLTGLGPLDIPIPTGAPGPASPLSHPLIPFACSIANWEAVVSSVSYAPGLTGFYQADIAVPSGPSAGDSNLFCKVTGSTFLFSSTALISTTP